MEVRPLAGADVDAVIRVWIETKQRKGVGAALLARAIEASPAGIELHTHVENTKARAFYEKMGFVAARFGISPAPESLPDVEYQWRP
jgi:ribosomal protein S18 acetylase RimI-like enzyme